MFVTAAVSGSTAQRRQNHRENKTLTIWERGGGADDRSADVATLLSRDGGSCSPASGKLPGPCLRLWLQPGRVLASWTWPWRGVRWVQGSDSARGQWDPEPGFPASGQWRLNSADSVPSTLTGVWCLCF